MTSDKRYGPVGGLGHMCWVALSGKDAAAPTMEKRLWDAANQFRPNPGLKAPAFASSIPGSN
jgi:type I restriction enzyme M protein